MPEKASDTASCTILGVRMQGSMPVPSSASSSSNWSSGLTLSFAMVFSLVFLSEVGAGFEFVLRRGPTEMRWNKGAKPGRVVRIHQFCAFTRVELRVEHLRRVGRL